MDEENVLDFLTSLEAMDLPDRIEEVNARILGKIIEDTEFVAVLFCKQCEQLTGRITVTANHVNMIMHQCAFEGTSMSFFPILQYLKYYSSPDVF